MKSRRRRNQEEEMKKENENAKYHGNMNHNRGVDLSKIEKHTSLLFNKIDFQNFMGVEK
ncbi:MAG: hypothetical protein GF364_15085 [Candidatus Lokiarchaeota archaeon]|nr:hypothetical protein [Candidatus Lokiarchaeota archaeon]